MGLFFNTSEDAETITFYVENKQFMFNIGLILIRLYAILGFVYFFIKPLAGLASIAFSLLLNYILIKKNPDKYTDYKEIMSIDKNARRQKHKVVYKIIGKDEPDKTDSVQPINSEKEEPIQNNENVQYNEYVSNIKPFKMPSAYKKYFNKETIDEIEYFMTDAHEDSDLDEFAPEEYKDSIKQIQQAPFEVIFKDDKKNYAIMKDAKEKFYFVSTYGCTCDLALDYEICPHIIQYAVMVNKLDPVYFISQNDDYSKNYWILP